MTENSPGNPDLLKTLTGLAENASKPEVMEPGPGDVQPTTQTTSSPLVTLQMTEEEVTAWWKRVELSDNRIAHESKTWDVLLKEYMAVVKASGTEQSVKVAKHFRNVHSKIGALFYRTPEITLQAKDPSPAQDILPNPMDPMGVMGLPPIRREDLIAVKQAVLEDKLGRDNINYSRLMDELLFDVLAWTGIGCSKIGYNVWMKPIQEPVMGPDPNFMPAPGSMLGLQPPPQVPVVVNGQPLTREVMVPVHEEWYERRFSPKKLITNADLYSTRIDQDATFMGMHFYISKKKAMKVYGITEADIAQAGAKDDKRYIHDGDQATHSESDLLHGVELWVRAASFTEEFNPLVIYQLVLIKGMKKPAVWRPSPDQTVDERGRLTQDSLLGFPIKILTIRDLADSPFPQADSAFTDNEVKQLNTHRRQSVALRDVAIGHYLYDAGAFEDEQLSLLKSGNPGRYIPVGEGRMVNGRDRILDLTAQVHATPDSWRTDQMLNSDIDETLGISRVQSGAPEETVRSATEIANIQTAVAGRNNKELGRTTDFFLDSVRKLDQLLMRYATEDETVLIAGDDGLMRTMVWNNKIISGRYLYDISPDSQTGVDTPRERKDLLDFHQLTANNPIVNQPYVLRRLSRMYGLDPVKAINPLAAGIGMPMMPPGGPTTQPGASGSSPSPSQPPGQGTAGGPGAPPPGQPLNTHILTKTGGIPNAPGAEPRR